MKQDWDDLTDAFLFYLFAAVVLFYGCSIGYIMRRNWK